MTHTRQRATPLTLRWASSAAFAAALLATGCGSDSAESLFKAGETLMQSGDPAGAAIQLKASLQSNPELMNARRLLGRALLASGDAAGAVVEFDKTWAKGSGDDETAALLARALVESGQAKRLVSQFDTLKLTNPSAQAALKTSLAQAWAQLGNRTKAQALLDEAASADPAFGLAAVLRAQLQADGGDVDGALASVERVLTANPKLAEGWMAKGELLAFGKGQTEPGRKALEQAQSLNRYLVQSYGHLANLALQRNDVAGAAAQAAALEKALPSTPHSLFIRTQIDLKEGRLKDARDKAQMLLRVGADNVGVLLLAGVVEARSNAFVVAESHFSKALSLDPKLDAARRNLALVSLNLGRPDRALDTLKPIAGPESRDSAALAIAGEASLRAGNAKAAEGYFSRAAALTPADSLIATSLAVSQLRQGSVERALADLSNLSKTDPKEIAADMALISARMSRLEWPQALQAIEAALAKRPDDTGLLELLGRVHVAKGNVAAARAAFDKALAIDPKFLPATLNLTALDLGDRRPDTAIARMKKAASDDPRNIYASLALADVLAKTGAALADQQAALAQAIAANPGETVPRVALVDLNLANSRFRDALQVAQDAVAALPAAPTVLDALGRAQAAAGEVQQAISSYRRLTNIDPKDTASLSRLADLYRSSGDRKNAEVAWRRVAELDPRFPGVQGRIVDLLAAGKKPSEALAEARAMQSNATEGPLGYMLEASLHRRAKQLEPAAQALRTGMGKHPKNVELAIRLYQVELALGRRDSADKLAARWPKDNPEDTVFELEQANYHMLSNELPVAERGLRSALVRHADDPSLLNNLAFVLVAQKKAGGVALAERALARSSQNPNILDTYAAALALDGQFLKAVEVQRRAVALSPADPNLRLTLARLALAGGNKGLARTELDALSTRVSEPSLRAEIDKLTKQL